MNYNNNNNNNNNNNRVIIIRTRMQIVVMKLFSKDENCGKVVPSFGNSFLYIVYLNTPDVFTPLSYFLKMATPLLVVAIFVSFSINRSGAVV